jgi:hypothetical protein
MAARIQCRLARLCAYGPVFFVDVVRVELADSERSELEMLDAYDLSRCHAQRSFEALR